MDPVHDPTASPFVEVLRLPSCMRTVLTDGQAASFERLELAPARPRSTLRTLLEQHLASYGEGPFGVTTGGLDSSSVLAVARHLGKDAHCVSIDLGGQDADRPFVEQLCRHLGIRPHFISANDGLAALPHDLTIDGAPLAWPSAALEIACFRRARSLGASQMLTGAAGDDLFDEDRAVAARVLESGRIRAAVAIARPSGSPFSALRDNLLRPWLRRRVPWSLRGSLRALRAQAKLPVPEFLALPSRLVRDESWLRHAEVEDLFEASPEARLSRLLHSSHFEALAYHRSLSEAATGMVRRDPFLEPDIVSLVAYTSPEEHFLGPLPRGLLRRAVEDLLPRTVWERTSKAGIEVVCGQIVTHLRSRLEGLADMSALADLGLVEPRLFRPAFEEWIASPASSPQGFRYLWPSLAIEAWLRGAFDLPGRFEGSS